MMRRARILFGGLLIIVAAIPILPGPGSLVIEETLAVLEREFRSVRWLLDVLAIQRESGSARGVAGFPARGRRHSSAIR
jgi:hypothetical protein